MVNAIESIAPSPLSTSSVPMATLVSEATEITNRCGCSCLDLEPGVHSLVHCLGITIGIKQHLGSHAQGALAAGRAVIANAVFAREAEREAVAAVALEAGVRFLGLWLEASVEIPESRIRGRGRTDASDATVAVLHRQLAGRAERVRWTLLDAAAEVEDCLTAARGVLDGSASLGRRGRPTGRGAL